MELTLTEFRRDTKKYFDKAITEPVYIIRGGVTFCLASNMIEGVPEKQAPVRNNDVSDLLTPEKIEATPKDERLTNPVDVYGTRYPGDVLADVRDAERERDEEIRYCQDPQEAMKISDRWKNIIQPLWDEYHNMTEARKDQ